MLALLTGSGCAGTPAVPAAQRVSNSPSPFPSWIDVEPGLLHSPELDEAAALLCARDTDAIIDDDLRRATGLADGQARGVLFRGARSEARAALAMQLDPLRAEVDATHLGVVEGDVANGSTCVAAVLVRRLLSLATRLPAKLAPAQSLSLSVAPLDPAFAAAEIYLAGPDGSVQRLGEQSPLLARTIAPRVGEGRYVLEVILHRTGPRDRARDQPEVALIWPFVVGTPRLAPVPKVLFPDEGHSDAALSYRLEALVARLRNTQMLSPLKIAPDLKAIAATRAAALTAAGKLGHRLPDDESAAEQVAAAPHTRDYPTVSEVQAQAGTLAEAWRALLESPAHRYVLVSGSPTHLGAAVSRGRDGLGRDLVSLVVLVAKKTSQRPVAELATELAGRLNLARHRQGLPPLGENPMLRDLANALAAKMARAGVLVEELQGRSITELAMERDAALADVRVIVAHLDDPLRLGIGSAVLAEDANQMGIGLVRGPREWFLCVLVGAREGAPPPR